MASPAAAAARTHSLHRQRWNTGRESPLSKSNKPAVAVSKHCERMRSTMNGEGTGNISGRAAPYFGELGPPVVRASTVAAPTSTAMQDATTIIHASSRAGSPVTSVRTESFRGGSSRSRFRDGKEEQQTVENDLLPEEAHDLEGLGQCYPVDLPKGLATSIQTETEGTHSRLLRRGGESSSFRGKQLSTSSRRESSSFRRETVSSSCRRELGSSRRKATKSFQDVDMSSIASESVQDSPSSIQYNHAPSSSKRVPAAPSVAWASSPSSPENGQSSVPFQWEEAPGKAKTIAAATEMALARKQVRDESLRKLTAACPRTSVDGQNGSWHSERKEAPASSGELPLKTPPSPALPLPPAQRVSQEFPCLREDSHALQLLEDLKAAVARKQAVEKIAASSTTVQPAAEVEEDTKSVMSDYGAGETHIDLVAPAAAKFLNREDDTPDHTPIIDTDIAVPFKWEEAPGKPKDCPASPARTEAPLLSLPPRLLGGCRNPSKEQHAKILQTYSGNLEMHWNSSGTPTPLSRSREATPTRRERTPNRRDRTPTKRDSSSGKRDITPTRRDSTPTRSYFPARSAPKSGPLTFATVENVRDHQHSGPLRSNTGPNYLNGAPKSVSQELARVSQEQGPPISHFPANAKDRKTSESKPSSDVGSGPLLYSHQSSLNMSQELETVRFDSPSPDIFSKRTKSYSLKNPIKEPPSSSVQQEQQQEGGLLGKVSNAVDPLSPTSILFCPDMSSQRSASNLSSAYAESSHSHRPGGGGESISGHSKSDSASSLESFTDETYNLPPPWQGVEAVENSPYRDLGPIEVAGESVQGSRSVEDGVKAIFKFCRKAKDWNKPKIGSGKGSAEPDMWAPTLTTYFQKLELSGTILTKVDSQVNIPESKEGKAGYHGSQNPSVPTSPLKMAPGEVTAATPDRSGAGRRLSMGSVTPIHVMAACRSPSYRTVLATDECFSLFSLGKVWSGTKARHAKWGRKMRRSSRLMAAVFAALKRSMLMKCGRQSLPVIQSDRNLLDGNCDATTSRELPVHPQPDAVHSLSADHQFHKPL